MSGRGTFRGRGSARGSIRSKVGFRRRGTFRGQGRRNGKPNGKVKKEEPKTTPVKKMTVATTMITVKKSATNGMTKQFMFFFAVRSLHKTTLLVGTSEVNLVP